MQKALIGIVGIFMFAAFTWALMTGITEMTQTDWSTLRDVANGVISGIKATAGFIGINAIVYLLNVWWEENVDVHKV